MHRRAFLQTGTTAALVGIAGCLDGGSGPAFSEGFEDGLVGWDTGAAIGPEVDVADFEWEVTASDSEAAAGEQSMRIWNEGDYDDGVTWGVHPVPVEAGRAYEVTVTAQYWSESESFNTIRDAVIRLGPRPPTVEADFPQPGVNTSVLGETPYGGLREPLWLVDGWTAYTFEWTTPELSTDELFLALGDAVIWEADATHYVDAVTVEFEAR